MDKLDMIIHQMDDILKEQEYTKYQLNVIISKINLQADIISAIENKINNKTN